MLSIEQQRPKPRVLGPGSGRTVQLAGSVGLSPSAELASWVWGLVAFMAFRFLLPEGLPLCSCPASSFQLAQCTCPHPGVGSVSALVPRPWVEEDVLILSKSCVLGLQGQPSQQSGLSCVCRSPCRVSGWGPGAERLHTSTQKQQSSPRLPGVGGQFPPPLN